MVDVRFRERFKRTITLAELKNHRALAELILLRKGNRLSIMPISAAAWRYILKLE